MHELPDSTRSWIERTLGGVVVRAERQPRWRPAWFIDVERDGSIESLYLRGERGGADHGVYGLDHEYRVLTALERNGVRVPHVFGWCDSPPAILMAKVPGRANLATSRDDAERIAVLKEYIDELAKIHAIDVSTLPDLDPAAQLAESGPLADLDRWEAAYRQRKPGPQPLIEFGLRWLRQHAPATAAAPALIHGDSGQFHFDDGHVTALFDFELAYVGDPAADLACLVLRDISEPMGALRPAFAHYAAVTGQPIDIDLIRFHIARFALCTPMSIAHVVATPRAEFNPMQYLTWAVSFSRIAIEFMAKLSGVELVFNEGLPSGAADGELDALVEMLEPAGGRDEATAYQFETAHRLALYVQRRARYGDELAQRDRADMAAVLGYPPSDVATGERALDELVMNDSPIDERSWLQYLYRTTMRRQLIVEPSMGRHRGRHAQLLD